MNCLIVDDDKAFHIILKKMISLEPTLNLFTACFDATSAYQQILSNRIDLLFLDIDMPGMSGVELAMMLQDERPLIIFVTSSAEYAVEAFNLDVVDFLMKPFEVQRFLKAVTKAKALYQKNLEQTSKTANRFVFIRDSNVVRKLNLDDVLFLEAKDNYVKIYMADHTYSVHSPLKSIAEKLPAHFLRVHRSFIINLDKVDTMEGSTIFINKMVVPVSDAYRNTLNKRMQFL